MESITPVDCRYISAFVRDIPLLATRHVDWNFLAAAIAFWNPSHAVFDIQARRLQSRNSYFFIESRAHWVQGDFLRKDLCHAILLLIFGTLLFPRSHSLIDAALASVVLQVVGGRGYEVALVVETIRSLDRVLRTCDRRIRGSPMLLQIWFQSHANPLRLLRSIMYFNGPESIISRLLPLLRVEERKVSEWIKIFREIAPRGFKWRATWMPPGPMTLRCPDFYGVPLMSHAGSITYFPTRVVRQLGGL
ncbi:hypothetical protein CRG98_018030 [Punica granatum]|uniref:DUF7745 domain-containing protein n=1 Tax=Punica granatum TaxID=22663 RepID=A0A2I0JYV9_PUNGR|nr:hypothetical protein CRG98_018030 [Punica granatum]